MFSHTLFAETLLLQNGEIVRGQITAEDQNTVLIETESGPRSFERGEIRKIFYSEAQEEVWRKSEGLPSEDASKTDGAISDATSPRAIAWRAAAWNIVLPGSAQWRRGQNFRGFAYSGGSAFALYHLYTSHRRFRSTENDYNNVADTLYVWPANFAQSLIYGYQLNNENRLYSLLKTRSNEREQAAWLLVAVYVWQLVDALWLSPNGDSAALGLDAHEGAHAFRLDFFSERSTQPMKAVDSATEDDRIQFDYSHRF
ncbi:MAG: hypothetical protein NXI24_15915 [bacterium]|nr:hypothetical protein [bacterium]